MFCHTLYAMEHLPKNREYPKKRLEDAVLATDDPNFFETLFEKDGIEATGIKEYSLEHINSIFRQLQEMQNQCDDPRIQELTEEVGIVLREKSEEGGW